MADIRKIFGTNRDAETKGVTINYEGQFKVTIARAGGANKSFEKALERKTRPFKRALQTGRMTNEQSMEILREVYAETVVLGWEGVELDGKKVTFSKENCLKLFKELPDFFSDLMEQAQSIALFREDVLEEDAKNS